MNRREFGKMVAVALTVPASLAALPRKIIHKGSAVGVTKFPIHDGVPAQYRGFNIEVLDLGDGLSRLYLTNGHKHIGHDTFGKVDSVFWKQNKLYTDKAIDRYEKRHNET